ncbi:MAG TPA: Hsp70 family protein, partial [Kofleriaceae bacterium]|nr:Hsp70 family protein [Kofleriaceae bacterium]
GSLEQRMMRDPSQPLQVQFDTREPVAASPLARGSTPIPLDPDIKLELDDFGTYLTPPPPPMPLDAQFSSGDVMPGFDIDLEPTPPPSAPPLPPPSRPRGRVVIDVTPQSLGVGTLAGYCEILIRNSSPLPTQIKRPFVTVRDNQESVRIVVCQGEARRIEENIVLGDVVLHDLPRRPRGSVIEVEFTLDSSGMLQVTARDAETGQAREVTLDLVGRMDAQEIAAARERIESLTS